MLKALTVIALLVGTAVCAVAQESARCSLANTAGMWAFQNHGKTPSGEFNGVGTIHIAKDGTITGRGWITVAGTVSSEVPLAGTTMVSANCTSTGTFQNSTTY